jgi:hypothetical protein
MTKNNDILTNKQMWGCENGTKNSQKIDIFYRKTLFFFEKRFSYTGSTRLK